ncbi:hypothetical protein JB92DRAFT_2832212 [Gautieria morchelliformis]|nr:hypothetical protein JB92DRAFT_2832212 [Gautieria morchelliformis]
MGNNTMAATSAFQPNNSPQGLQTLNDFVAGTDVLLQIVGFNGSTAVPSLLQAFESLSISATLHALNSTLLQSAALKSPCDQIDVIVSLGGIQYISSSDADGTKVSQKRQGNNANIFISAVSISDYPTTLDFTQLAVPVATDDSLNLLLRILAQPIVQKIITGAVLVINTVLISTPQETAFVDAEIEFGAGLTISWQGQPLGSIAMPKVQVIGNALVLINARALLTQEDFVWDITGENLHHRTGNYLTLQTTVTNPSQVGVQLSSIGFNNFVGETLLGPAASSSGFTLTPQFIATFNLPLVGRLIHQDSASGLATATATFQIPFAFPIDIVALEQNIMATLQGQSFAELVIHKGPSQTDVNTHVIHLTFSDVPFAVFSDKFAVFEQFLMQATISSSEKFELLGAANTDTSTAIGTLSLTGINFDVSVIEG